MNLVEVDVQPLGGHGDEVVSSSSNPKRRRTSTYMQGQEWAAETHNRCPFLQYALWGWGSHTQRVASSQTSRIWNLLKRLLNSPRFFTIQKLYAYDARNTVLLGSLLPPLHLCIFVGAIEMGHRIIDEGICSGRAVDNLGNTALHVAVTVGNLQAISFLLTLNDLNADKSNNLGETALSVAMRGRLYDIVSVLVESGKVDTTVRFPDGNAPLHFAILASDTHMMKLTWGPIKRCHSANPQCSALTLALETESEIMLTELVNLGAHLHPTSETKQMLLRSAYWGRYRLFSPIVPVLGDEVLRMTRDDEGRSLLLLATEQYWEDAVRHMITHSDLDVTERDRNGRTLLHWAAYHHWHGILTLSLGKQDAPKNAQDKDGLTPLHIAVRERNLEGAQLLVLKGASTRIRDNRQYTPAHIAAEEGHKDIFQFLLSCEPTTLGETAQSETTLLHLACAVDWEHIVRKLVIEYHFDVFAVDRAWKTPLHIAAEYGSARVAKCLISHGAPLEYRDIVGWTPVHLSVKGHDPKTVRLLIASGARTTTRTNQGQSCLHLAIQHQFYEIAEELLQHPGCADVCQPDHAGRSPLDLVLADQGKAKVPENLFMKILGLSIEPLRSTERQAHLEGICLRLRDPDRRHLLREIASSYHCSISFRFDENPSQR